MKRYNADAPGTIYLGIQGENRAKTIAFDCKVWADEYGPGEVQLLHRRCGETESYPVPLRKEGELLIWDVSNVDTACKGKGKAQLLYFVGGGLAKSSLTDTDVQPSLSEPGPVPDAQKPFLDAVTQQAAKAEQARQAIQNLGVAAQEGEQTAVEKYVREDGSVQLMFTLQPGPAGRDAPQIDDTQASRDNPWSGRKTQQTAIGMNLEGARAGDTVKIKTVDVQGRPTEWELVKASQAQLIERVTMKNAAVFARNAEPDGTPYRFSWIKVKMEIPNMSSGGAFFLFLYAGNKVVQEPVVGYGTAVRYVSVEERENNGYWEGTAKYNRGGIETSYDNVTGEGYKHDMQIPVANLINKLESIGGTVPAGTKIEIWAVRA